MTTFTKDFKLSNNINSDYFFHGTPANYALVGAHDRRIWLVVVNEDTAHEIRLAFASKISLIVVDLRTFKNYSDGLIDNKVCLSWSIPVDEYIKLGIIKNIVTPVFTTTYKSSGEGMLVNSVPFFNFLSESNQKELQHQMMFFHYLLNMLFYVLSKYEKTLFDIEVDQKIKLAFATELTIPNIKFKLVSTANEVIGYSDLTPHSRSRAFCVLRLLDKLYE